MTERLFPISSLLGTVLDFAEQRPAGARTELSLHMPQIDLLAHEIRVLHAEREVARGDAETERALRQALETELAALRETHAQCRPSRRAHIRAVDVLARLSDQPVASIAIAKTLGVSPLGMSNHMAYLVRCGWVRRTRVRGYFTITDAGRQHLAAHSEGSV